MFGRKLRLCSICLDLGFCSFNFFGIFILSDLKIKYLYRNCFHEVLYFKLGCDDN